MNNIPTILVLLGATGDLVARKIAPAIFHLFRQEKLPDRFQAVGFSRRDLDHASFRAHLSDALKKHKDISCQGGACGDFLNLFSFCQGDFDSPDDYAKLAQTLKSIDVQWGVCTNKLFYLAVPPEFYKIILRNLAASSLTESCGPNEGWTRVIVEKPFGKDAGTAQELDALLGKLFREIQIYRIDHYLAKEMIQNILNFRFSNNIFEQSWNNQFVERIEIRLRERIGVEDRGAFYDGVGALRDVGQNHLLQMLAFITMDNPAGADAESIRARRAELLSSLRQFTHDEVRRAAFRAQYKGYELVRGVSPESQTETYFRVRAALESSRWQGVPIVMEGGKSLSNARKEIVVTFKHPRPCLCPKEGEHHKNRVVFSLEPREGITIQFWAKKPGLRFETEERTLDFLLRGTKNEAKKMEYVEEYEKLLLDCIAGDQTLFVSTQEVQAMWRFIDPIISAWQNNVVPLMRYDPQSDDAVRASLFLDTDAKFLKKHASFKKEIGIVGLGKMGEGIARNLLAKGWRVAGYDRGERAGYDIGEKEFTRTKSLSELADGFSSPRIIWLMVPAGKSVDDALFGKDGILSRLSEGDTVVDGGNSFYKDSVARAKKLAKRSIRFLDAGVSGGPAGARFGACLMIGGDRKSFEALEPLFSDLAVPGGYQFFPGAGAGHFAKMVHNGVEYGMMQAFAEGFSIMKKTSYKLDLLRIADVYNHGSVIESRLAGWLFQAFQLHGENLRGVSGSPAHTGEGAWTVDTAKKMKLKAKVIEEALKFRIRSEKNPSYAGKIISALREQFGGHRVK